MTDVEAGGATVFPYVGARVMPKKVGKIIHRWYANFGAQLKNTELFYLNAKLH